MSGSPRYRYYTATTLDGFLADEHDSLTWLYKQDVDDNGPGNAEGLITEVGALAMGATTYLGVLKDGADWLPQVPTFVFTHRNMEPAHEHVVFLAGEPMNHRSAIEKATNGRDVWVMGGGDLAASFASAGMLDEVEVSIAPVLLGSGKPLFNRPFDLALRNFDRNRDFLTATFDVVGPLGSR